MKERVTVILDFTKCRFRREIYSEMREKMEWDDYYGENLDALWDILTGMPYKGDDFIIRRPVEYTNIPYGHNAVFTEYMDKLCEVFEMAQEEEENDLTVKIEYLQDEN